MKLLRVVGLAAGLIAGVAVAAQAASPAEKAVKVRQGYMQVMSVNSGPLFGMLKGKVAYDAKRAQMYADNLKLLARMQNLGAMWPKGSDNTNPALKGKTTAVPAIWAADSKFRDQWKDWRKAVFELASVAGKGKDALSAKVKALGGTCAACHKAGREKK